MDLKAALKNRLKASSLMPVLALAVVSACTDSQLLESTAVGTATSIQGCLAATPLDTTRIKIDFEFPSGAKKVAVYRDGTLITTSASATVTSFVDTRLREGQTYRYTCEGIFPDGVRSGKNVLNVSTIAFNAPHFGGIDSAQTSSAHAVTVRWKPASNEGPAVAYYQIFAKAISQSVSLDLSQDSPKTTVPIGQIETTIEGLGDELKYAFAVRACTKSHICDNNTISKIITLPDDGAPATAGATEATLVDAKAVLTVPWAEAQGAITKRRVYLSMTGGTHIGAYTLIRTDLVPDPLVVPPTITLDGLAENKTYFFIVRDEDPSGRENQNTNVVWVKTTDLTPPVFSGIESLENVPLEGDPSYPAPAAERKLLAKWTAIASQPAVSSGASVYILTVTSAPELGTPADPCAAPAPIRSIEIPAKDYATGAPVTYAIDSLEAKTTYSVCVKARDEALNVSKTTSFRTRTTKDQTAPVFNGISSNPEFAYAGLTVGWIPSASSDIRNYRIRLWKGTPLDPTPIGGLVREFSVSHSASPNDRFTFVNDILDPFYLVAGETVYALVDACDNASPTYNTRDNCSALTNARSVTINDITPPMDFLGVSTLTNVPQVVPPFKDCTTGNDCRVRVQWLKGGIPGDWSDYAGFNIYRVRPGGICEKLSTALPCSCLGGVCPASCDAIVKTAYEDITLAVTAYDRQGNETSCDALTPSASIRTLDQAAPVPPSTGTAILSTMEATGAQITWEKFTDNQYPLTPGVSITYQLYRKESFTSTDTFADLSAPDDDPNAMLVHTVLVTDASIPTMNWINAKANLKEGAYYFYTVCAKDVSNNRSCLGQYTRIQMEDATPPVASAVTVTHYGGTPGSWKLQWSMSDNLTPAQNLTVKVWRKAAHAKTLDLANPDPELWPIAAGPADYTMARTDAVTLPDVTKPPSEQIFTVKIDRENNPAEPRSISITQQRWINYLIEISDSRFNKKYIYASAFSGTVFTKANNGSAANLISDAYSPDPTLGAMWILQPGAIVKMQRETQLALNYLELQGDLVDGGSVLEPAGCTTTKCYTVNLNVTGDALVDRYASINADGKGYLGGYSLGADGVREASAGRTNGNVPNSWTSQAGSHGGFGRYNPSVYGDFTQPSLPGAGGGGAGNDWPGGNGGGVIRLKVTGTLTFNGNLSANGGNAVNASMNGSSTGAGAGGSIWIETEALQTTAGTPLIQANGGNRDGKGGGGGRIAVYYSTLSGLDLTSGSTVQAFGGNTGGGPGSIYYRNKSTAKAHLRFDNNGLTPEQATPISPVPASGTLPLAELVVDRQAKVIQESLNYNLTLEKLTIQNGATFNIPDNFDGSTATVGAFTSGMTAVTRNWFSYSSHLGAVPGTNLIEYDAGTLNTLTIDATNLETFKNRNWIISGGEIVEIKLDQRIPILSLDLRGTLTHPACTTTQCYKVDLDIAGSATIFPTGAINVDGKGYLGARVTGHDGVQNNSYAGRTDGNTTSGLGIASGSHGGRGGKQGSDLSTKPYGDFAQPDKPGGGGGEPSGWVGGNGGGVIRLTIAGNLTLNGAISAGGAKGNIYAGAGGSIWLDVQGLGTTGGTPKIVANGATPGYVGAGGGRVALYYASLSGIDPGSRSTVQAFGAAGSSGSGGAGSIYYKNKTSNMATLRFDNNNVTPQTATELAPHLTTGTISVDALIIDGRAAVKQESVNYRFSVGTLTIQGSGSLSIPDNFDGSSTTAGIITSGMTGITNTWFSYSSGNPGTGLTEYNAGPTAVLTIDATNVASFEGGTKDWLINPGELVEIKLDRQIQIRSLDLRGILTHTGCTNATCYRVDLDIVNDATIASTGTLNVDGKGYLGGYATGSDGVRNSNTKGRTEGNALGSEFQSGGSHGGLGGQYGPYAVASAYGNFMQPFSPGGGGGGIDIAPGGSGGGIIRLNVAGRLVLNGTISSNGGNGSTVNVNAPGAGGSIWLQVNSFETASGSPLVTANGSKIAYGNASNGGGGRIAMYYTSLSGINPASSATFQAFGGNAGTNYRAGAGTVYYKATADLRGSLRYDNNGFPSQNSSPLGLPGNANVELADLFLSNGAKAKQTSSTYSINVSGTTSLTNTSTLSVPIWGANDGIYGTWFSPGTLDKDASSSAPEI